MLTALSGHAQSEALDSEDILMASTCNTIERGGEGGQVGHFSVMSPAAKKFSFGKFLELFFNETQERVRCVLCGCSPFEGHHRFFTYKDMVCKLEVRSARIFGLGFARSDALLCSQRIDFPCFDVSRVDPCPARKASDLELTRRDTYRVVAGGVDELDVGAMIARTVIEVFCLCANGHPLS